jgi:hypothetical protein
MINIFVLAFSQDILLFCPVFFLYWAMVLCTPLRWKCESLHTKLCISNRTHTFNSPISDIKHTRWHSSILIFLINHWPFYCVYVFFLIGIVGGGIQLGPLGTVANNGPLCQPRVIMMEKLMEWLAGETEGKPATNRLIYGTALCVFIWILH